MFFIFYLKDSLSYRPFNLISKSFLEKNLLFFCKALYFSVIEMFTLHISHLFWRTSLFMEDKNFVDLNI